MSRNQPADRAASVDPRDLLLHSNDEPAAGASWSASRSLLNALDGFDVLSISFASPGIAAEWGIDRAALGFVLSMELIGMAHRLDRARRRRRHDRAPPTILGCLVVMAAGMLWPTTRRPASSPCRSWRIVTGLGIGGMLAAINAVAAEFSNNRRRHLSVSLMSIGYPLGAVRRRPGGRAAPARPTTGARCSISAPRSRPPSFRSSSSSCPNRCTGWRASSRLARSRGSIATLDAHGSRGRRGAADDSAERPQVRSRTSSRPAWSPRR